MTSIRQGYSLALRLFPRSMHHRYMQSTNPPNNLLRWRTAREWTAQQVADHVGSSQASITRIEQRQQMPRRALQKKLTDLFGYEVDDFYDISKASTGTMFISVPLRTSDEIAKWKTGDLGDLSTASATVPCAVPVPRLSFATHVTDDSMHPKFNKGDMVIASPCSDLVPGCFVLASVNQAIVLGVYRPNRLNEKGKAYVELAPLNHNHPVFRSDVAKLKILGRIVLHLDLSL